MERKIIVSENPDGNENDYTFDVKPGETITCISWGSLNYSVADTLEWSILENSIVIWKKVEVAASDVGSIFVTRCGAEKVAIPIDYTTIVLRLKAAFAEVPIFLVVTLERQAEWAPREAFHR